MLIKFVANEAVIRARKEFGFTGTNLEVRSRIAELARGAINFNTSHFIRPQSGPIPYISGETIFIIAHGGMVLTLMTLATLKNDAEYKKVMAEFTTVKIHSLSIQAVKETQGNQGYSAPERRPKAARTSRY